MSEPTTAAPTSGAAVTLVLASASPARLTTLRRAGVEPVVVVSDVDEDAALERAAADAGHPLAVAEQVAVLAAAKAAAVARRLGAGPRAAGDDAGSGRVLVLGCDSLLEVDGRAHGKPATAERATARWRALSGRSGVLHTGHHLLLLKPPGPRQAAGATAAARPAAHAAVSSTRVHFAEVDEEEIAAYVATGEPLAVAGAFTLDGYGGAFVTGVEGDHHGVIGLSLPTLRTLVRAHGLRWTDLWAAPGDPGPEPA